MQTDELVQWLKFIENPGNKEVQKFMSENKYLKQAKEENGAIFKLHLYLTSLCLFYKKVWSRRITNM
jgi:hypothetical protein